MALTKFGTVKRATSAYPGAVVIHGTGATPRRPGAWRGDVCQTSGQIEAVSVHDLRPGGNEVLNELLLVVILRINLGVGAQDGV